jgi:hypothetical protein
LAGVAAVDDGTGAACAATTVDNKPKQHPSIHWLKRMPTSSRQKGIIQHSLLLNFFWLEFLACHLPSWLICCAAAGK